METLKVGSEKAIGQKDNSLQEASGELKRKEQEIKVLQDERFRTKEELLIEKCLKNIIEFLHYYLCDEIKCIIFAYSTNT